MPDEVARQFLDRLWELQADAQLSTAELARRLNVSPQYLYRMRTRERGNLLTLAFARRAAGIFDALAIFLTPIVTTSTETAESSIIRCTNADDDAEGESR